MKGENELGRSQFARTAADPTADATAPASARAAVVFLAKTQAVTQAITPHRAVVRNSTTAPEGASDARWLSVMSGASQKPATPPAAANDASTG